MFQNSAYDCLTATLIVLLRSMLAVSLGVNAVIK